MPKINAYEVAKLAHVSPSTVSRAINHRNLVNSQTLRQIDDAMKKIHYQFEGNHVSELVIVNVPDLGNIFSIEVMKGINAAATANNLRVLIDQTVITEKNVTNYIQWIEKFHPYGLITLHQLSTMVLEKISKSSRVVQCCEHNPKSNLPFVGINDYEASLKATNYLISSGKSRLGFINVSQDNRYAYQRQRGFIDAIKSHDLDVHQDWIISMTAINFDIAFPIIDQILLNPSRPEGFVCISDTIAAAVVKAAAKYHLKIPEDLAVIGFDNTVISRLTEPSLTTINLPKFQEGYTAIDLLTSSYTESSKVILPTELTIRQSTN